MEEFVQPLTQPTDLNSPVETSVVTPTTPTQSSRLPLILMTILFLLAASAAAYFYLQSRSVAPTAISDTASPAPEASATADPTVGWQIYNNQEYGFSFKYPSNFGNQGVVAGPVKGTTVALPTFSDPSTIAEGTDKPFNGFSVWVVTDSQANSLEEYVSREVALMNNSEYSRMQGATKIAIDNGVRVTAPDSPQAYYYLQSPNSRIIVVLAYIQENSSFQQTFDQILSTFEFTD